MKLNFFPLEFVKYSFLSVVLVIFAFSLTYLLNNESDILLHH